MGVIGGGSAAATGIGIVIGVAGIVMAGVNHPLYRRMLSRGKARYAADIMRLAAQVAEQG